MSYTKTILKLFPGNFRESLKVSSNKIYSISEFKMSVRKSHLVIKKYFNSNFIILIKHVTCFTLVYSGVFLLIVIVE